MRGAGTMFDQEDPMSDDPTNITLQVLVDIRDEMRGMREELRTGLADVNRRLDVTNQRLDVNNERLDRLVLMSGARAREHGERLDELEGRVTKLERRTPRRRPSGGRRR